MTKGEENLVKLMEACYATPGSKTPLAPDYVYSAVQLIKKLDKQVRDHEAARKEQLAGMANYGRRSRVA